MIGCNILAVVQQIRHLKDSALRGAIIGNSKILLKPNFAAPMELQRV
jgi:hypothetical protein